MTGHVPADAVDPLAGERLRVLVVDDHPVVRRGLRAMLEAEPWVDEIIDAASAAEAVRQAVARRVDVAAMDVGLPDADGIDATRRIVAALPGVRILMLTLHDDPDVVARSLHAGAHGYLLKDSDPDTILHALRTVASGGVVLGPGVGPRLLTSLQGTPTRLPPPLDRLTARERDLLGRLAVGDNNSQIARHLRLSEKTVRNQLSTVFAKLGVADRVRAALIARDAGMGSSSRLDQDRARPPQR
jgi:DNA-binding NarL/FixJ family response regulator